MSLRMGKANTHSFVDREGLLIPGVLHVDSKDGLPWSKFNVVAYSVADIGGGAYLSTIVFMPFRTSSKHADGSDLGTNGNFARISCARSCLSGKHSIEPKRVCDGHQSTRLIRPASPALQSGY